MINTAYQIIINPINIRHYLKSDEEFVSWLEIGNEEDLECTLKVFEEAELYEDCVIIKNTLVKMQGAKDAINNTDIN